MSQLHRLFWFVLSVSLIATCGDERERAANRPAQPSVPAPVPMAGGAAPRPDRPRVPAKLTDADREVIAYLDAWEPAQKELNESFVTARKQATATRMDIARRREANPKAACNAIAAVLEHNAAWHREHPLPESLKPEAVQAYQSKLVHRQTVEREDLGELFTRLSRYLDGRDDFERHAALRLQQSVDDLKCSELP